ncbi:drug/metabolite transporter (DMT)-like permease [Anaerobacterium chartisolvens]|uniref:Drug/metabolite transporter (DMT)-like permease n=1 Tax=Anaerobacterium chartisolvens TaxID=1297424 RepID=A0A369AQZ4_9FIRM|nr:DMT family transporter [Anaerobacterium chartisolvens]RCX09874.1 drug/metabolite transporter (DMT)-like permease [Anaerobacterium chartisolvens]
MNTRKVLLSNLILLLAAIIWGFAFVAQRVSIKYVGPFTYNGVRFALGSLSLLPVMLLMKNKSVAEAQNKVQSKDLLHASIIAGIFLFTAASFQQIGLIYTSAGKAAFVTSLYIVFVPILGIFLRQRISSGIWLGALMALAGLYLLCVTESLTVSKGDWLELAGAFFWAFHILIIGYFGKRVNVVKLSCIQFAICSVLSLAAALIFEKIELGTLMQAAMPILYGGIFSVGVAYTLQAIGQKNANPSHAAIILSMEALFATVGGALFLKEALVAREITGCVLMLSGMLLSQLQGFRGQGTASNTLESKNQVV